MKDGVAFSCHPLVARRQRLTSDQRTLGTPVTAAEPPSPPPPAPPLPAITRRRTYNMCLRGTRHESSGGDGKDVQRVAERCVRVHIVHRSKHHEKGATPQNATTRTITTTTNYARGRSKRGLLVAWSTNHTQCEVCVQSKSANRTDPTTLKPKSRVD